jgi:hypothetical protein
MIGAPFPPLSASLYATPLRPLTAPAGPASASWLDGLGAGGGTSLRADVAPDQRGLSVQQHAERVLSALVA